MIAGEDAKALERISRYKTPADVGKALFEAQTKLSQRQEIPKLTADSTPEQVAEYRKAMGVPELAKDAPIERVFESYGIKAPDGYDLSEVEKGMVGDFAKHANAKHMPAGAVKDAVDFFFKSQAANKQAVNKLDVSRQKEWQSQLRDEMGRDFEPMIAAGEAFLNSHFGQDSEGKHQMLNAQMPGGGKLGDNPHFIKLVTDLALKNGFTDRIEANALESGGRSLAEQQRELEGLRTKDRAKYNEPATQEKLKKLISLRQARQEIDEWGNERKRA